MLLFEAASYTDAKTAAAVMAGPATYEIDGEQYIAVNVGYGGANAMIGGRFPRRPGRLYVYKVGGTVKAPEGHTYAWTENPLGVNGYYLVSRGEKTPWRLKLRTASFANVQALSTLLPGCLIPDLVAILGSMFFVVGDIDK